MKLVAGLLILPSVALAFLPSAPLPLRPYGSCRLAAVAAGDVLPEKTPGFTVKKVEDTNAADQVSKYSVSGFVTPAEYKKIYQETQAEHQKQANFRGYRAGKIPPGLMAAVREFAIVASVESACLAALEPYELEAVVPETGIPEIKINVPGDVADFSKSYNAKVDIKFEAELEAKGEPSGVAPEVEDVVDVTAKEVEPVSG